MLLGFGFPMLAELSPMTEPFEALGLFMDDYGTAILSTIALLLFGWLVARLIRALVVRLLRIVRLDVLAEKAGIDGFLRKGGMKQGSVDLLGGLTFWAVIILMVALVMHVWNMDLGLSQQIVPFIPRLLLALIILILGLYLAAFVADLISSAAASSKLKNPRIAGQAVRWILVAFVILTALQQLGIDATLISTAFLIVLASAGLAIGLAVGLGARPIVEEKLREMCAKKEPKE